MYIGETIITGIRFKVYKCDDCGHEYICLIDDEEHYCSNCYDVYPRRGTHSDRVRKIYDRNKNIVPIEWSITGMEDRMFKCLVCGHEWKKRVLSPGGCPECFRKRGGEILREEVISGEEKRYNKFVSLVKERNPDIEILEYRGYKLDVKAKCAKCNNVFETDPTKLRRSGACPICHPRHKWSRDYTKDFVEEMHPNLEVVGFKEGTNKVIVNCLEHDITFETYRTNIIRGHGCYKCSFSTTSYNEEEVYNLVSSIKMCEKRRFKTSKGWREVDIFIPDLNIGIEYDSLHFHSDLHKSDNYHYEKHNLLLNEFGVRTIHIREDELIDKKEIVESKIKFLLGKVDRKIYARKCYIKEVSSRVKGIFLDRYHIQGNDNSSIYYGLYFEGKIVSIMTFSKARNSLSSKEEVENKTYELVRFCSRTNLSVVGGFSKLLKHCENELYKMGISSIKTFADRRWSDGNVYIKNGFSLSHISRPNYIYIKNRNTYTRHSFQKHLLKDKLDYFEESLSERENMSLNGYSRYYDCGNMVFYKKIIR